MTLKLGIAQFVEMRLTFIRTELAIIPLALGAPSKYAASETSMSPIFRSVRLVEPH